MTSELMQRIKKEFSLSRYELISQIAITDEEYNELLSYIRNMSKYQYISSIIPNHLIFGKQIRNW